ncbi:MAG: hypothetical protein QRY72_03465 [Candidatus Rhabdochlamydia sp.]
MSISPNSIPSRILDWGTGIIVEKITASMTEKMDDFVRRSLDHVKDTARDVSQSTSEAARLVVSETAEQVIQAIKAFQAAYQESLHFTINECGRGAENAAHYLVGMMNEIAINPSVEAVSKNIEYYYKEILHKKMPFVKQVTPLCIAQSERDYDVLFQVSGIFSHQQWEQSNAKEHPTLSFAGRKFDCINDVGNTLTFLVPSLFLSYLRQSPEFEGNLIPYHLAIPYTESKISSQTQDFEQIVKWVEHKSYVLVLPQKIGVASFHYGKKIASEERKQISTQVYHQNSSSSGAKAHLINRIYTIEAEKDFLIDPQSIRFEVLKQVGMASHSLDSVTQRKIVYKVSTRRKKGELKFRIHYTAMRVKEEVSVIQEEKTLEWGQLIPFPSEVTAWKIQMQLFDGSSYQMNKEDAKSLLQNPFATVISPYYHPALKVATPEEVNHRLINQQFIRTIEASL